MRHRRLLPLLVATFLLTTYVTGYVVARSQHYLVHADETCSGHAVRMGDLGWDFANPHYEIGRLAYYLFTPLRWAETCCWRVLDLT